MKSSRGYISSLVWQFCSQQQVAFPVRESQANFCVPFVQHGRNPGQKLVQSWVFWGNSGLVMMFHCTFFNSPCPSNSLPWAHWDFCAIHDGARMKRDRIALYCNSKLGQMPPALIWCLDLCHTSNTNLKASSFLFPSSKLLEGRAQQQSPPWEHQHPVHTTGPEHRDRGPLISTVTVAQATY